MGKAKPTKHTGVLRPLCSTNTSQQNGAWQTTPTAAVGSAATAAAAVPFCSHAPAAAEIKAKAHAATTNMGGGKAGLQDRKGGAVGHAKYMCPICKTAAPSLTNMQVGTQILSPVARRASLALLL